MPLAAEARGTDLPVAGVLSAAALDERLAIVGTSGSGKTYAAKGLVEYLLEASARLCVVDPLGVWWGLRAGADGTTPGFPVVVFGGRHADVGLDEGMGQKSRTAHFCSVSGQNKNVAGPDARISANSGC